MTTPTNQPDRMTAEELRAAFELLHVEISELRTEITQIREGLTHASQPTPASTNGDTFAAVKIEREKRKGKYYYKMLGGQFTKHGITVWDEVLEAMGLDSAEYDEDDIHKLTPPLIVRFSSEPYTDEEGQTKHRRKVTGRA